jgi:hypothetical protein
MWLCRFAKASLNHQPSLHSTKYGKVLIDDLAIVANSTTQSQISASSKKILQNGGSGKMA